MQVMEHIGQRGNEHTAGTLQITKHPARLLRGRDAPPVSFFPRGELSEKHIPFIVSVYGGNDEK